MSQEIVFSEMLYENADGSFVVLTETAVKALMDGHAFFDPVTGEPVDDAAARTHVRFRLRGVPKARGSSSAEEHERNFE